MKQNDENRVVIKDGKVITIPNEEAQRTGLLNIDEALRLSLEGIELYSKLLDDEDN